MGSQSHAGSGDRPLPGCLHGIEDGPLARMVFSQPPAECGGAPSGWGLKPACGAALNPPLLIDKNEILSLRPYMVWFPCLLSWLRPLTFLISCSCLWSPVITPPATPPPTPLSDTEGRYGCRYERAAWKPLDFHCREGGGQSSPPKERWKCREGCRRRHLDAAGGRGSHSAARASAESGSHPS